MEQTLLLVALTNLVTAGLNIATACMNFRNRKKPSSGSARKALQKHHRG